MSYNYKWETVPSGITPTIEELAKITGRVTGIPLQALPSGYQKMNGLKEAYWSGNASGLRVVAGITGLGEILRQRVEDGILKSYANPIGASGVEYFIGTEFKKMPGHHASEMAPASYAELFGHVPWPAQIPFWPYSGIAAVYSGEYPPV